MSQATYATPIGDQVAWREAGSGRLLPAHLVAFLQGGVAATLGARKIDGRPIVGNGVACRIDAMTDVRVLLSKSAKATFLQTVADGSAVAVAGALLRRVHLQGHADARWPCVRLAGHGLRPQRCGGLRHPNRNRGWRARCASGHWTDTDALWRALRGDRVLDARGLALCGRRRLVRRKLRRGAGPHRGGHGARAIGGEHGARRAAAQRRRDPAVAAFSRDGRIFGALYAIWEDAADDAANVGRLRASVDSIAPICTGAYVGEADLERPDRALPTLSAAARARLEGLRATYDQSGLFGRPGRLREIAAE